MNLANVVEDEVVDALAASVKAAYPRLAHRYYKLKAKWFGVDTMPYWDRNAPLPEHDDRIDPVERGREDRARCLPRLLARAGRCRPEVLRHGLDRCAGAARQVARRLRPSHGAVGAPLSAAELPGQGARRHDPGARAGPRRAPGAVGAAGRVDGRHAAHPGRDRLGVRRDADLPVAAEIRARQVDAQGDAGRQGRGHAEHGGAPDRLLRFRIAPAHGAAQGRAHARRDRRDLDGGAEARAWGRPSPSTTNTGTTGRISATSSIRRSTSMPMPSATAW